MAKTNEYIGLMFNYADVSIARRELGGLAEIASQCISAAIEAGLIRQANGSTSSAISFPDRIDSPAVSLGFRNRALRRSFFDTVKRDERFHYISAEFIPIYA